VACAAAIVASSLTMVDCRGCSDESLCYPRRHTSLSTWERGDFQCVRRDRAEFPIAAEQWVSGGSNGARPRKTSSPAPRIGFRRCIACAFCM
jgi:hypothetical protein